MTPAVTHLMDAAAAGDPAAAADLLPLVYAELRALAAVHLAAEKPGQTLQPTALVHEAYLRLVGLDEGSNWNSRGHFFAAAAQAMRRILVDAARTKAAAKRGGGRVRLPLGRVPDPPAPDPPAADDLLALDDAVTALEQHDPAAAALVKLRYFAGLPVDQTAAALGVSEATAKRHWVYARAWLYGRLAGGGGENPAGS